MNAWALATELAIWILIGGSTAVFAWFLLEVLRLARRRHAISSTPSSGPDDSESSARAP